MTSKKLFSVFTTALGIGLTLVEAACSMSESTGGAGAAGAAASPARASAHAMKVSCTEPTHCVVIAQEICSHGYSIITREETASSNTWRIVCTARTTASRK